MDDFNWYKETQSPGYVTCCIFLRFLGDLVLQGLPCHDGFNVEIYVSSLVRFSQG